MIKKCDHPGCTKAGTCRAPKTRDLREYWWFCREHAAEYNKNWNYYAGMTPDEIEEDWERQTFGAPLKDKKQADQDNADYIKFLNDFITGRATFDKVPPRTSKTIPGRVTSALAVLNLPITATWREISARYRALAKRHQPDTATGDKDAAAKQFTKITDAYNVLKTHFGKK